ncbi:MAG: arginine repressor [Oscillospiraceae bacterium]|nr:arginine repressor [Oscillospiraceae bacterium]
MKSERQKKILEIIARENVETQNQLIEALSKEGVVSTQATLSRDIRELHLVKETAGDGSYRYVVSGKDSFFDHDQRLKKIFRESVVDYDLAQNLLVIKTLPGLADAACAALDSMEIPNLVGSIAGDDTAFVAMRDNAAAEYFYHEIEKLL